MFRYTEAENTDWDISMRHAMQIQFCNAKNKNKKRNKYKLQKSTYAFCKKIYNLFAFSVMMD